MTSLPSCDWQELYRDAIGRDPGLRGLAVERAEAAVEHEVRQLTAGRIVPAGRTESFLQLLRVCLQNKRLPYSMSVVEFAYATRNVATHASIMFLPEHTEFAVLVWSDLFTILTNRETGLQSAKSYRPAGESKFSPFTTVMDFEGLPDFATIERDSRFRILVTEWRRLRDAPTDSSLALKELVMPEVAERVITDWLLTQKITLQPRPKGERDALEWVVRTRFLLEIGQSLPKAEDILAARAKNCKKAVDQAFVTSAMLCVGSYGCVGVTFGVLKHSFEMSLSSTGPAVAFGIAFCLLHFQAAVAAVSCFDDWRGRVARHIWLNVVGVLFMWLCMMPFGLAVPHKPHSPDTASTQTSPVSPQQSHPPPSSESADSVSHSPESDRPIAPSDADLKRRTKNRPERSAQPPANGDQSLDGVDLSGQNHERHEKKRSGGFVHEAPGHIY